MYDTPGSLVLTDFFIDSPGYVCTCMNPEEIDLLGYYSSGQVSCRGVSFPGEIDLLGYYSSGQVSLRGYHSQGRLKNEKNSQILNQNQKKFNPLVSGPGTVGSNYEKKLEVEKLVGLSLYNKCVFCIVF